MEMNYIIKCQMRDTILSGNFHTLKKMEHKELFKTQYMSLLKNRINDI